jgi:hypothetical protein
MRFLVCGGQTYGTERDEDRFLYAALTRLYDKVGITAIIHGACHTPINADKLAGQWARDFGIIEHAYPVDHALDGPWPAAGNVRNHRMLYDKDSRPDGGVSFPGGNGTKHMTDLMRKAGLIVWEPRR